MPGSPASLRLVNLREVRQRLVHCEDSENATRAELVLAEDMAFNIIAAQQTRHYAATERRISGRRKKEDGEVIKAIMTMNRRIAGLLHEEQRRRIELDKQENLHIDAMLRVLERDIQVDVDQVQYFDAQRVKYFNKTVAVIHKNEGAGRRDIVNSERYEWLVLIQKLDAATLQLALHEKLRAFKASQRRKIEKFQQTSSSDGHRRATRVERARRRAKGIADGKTQAYRNVLPRTDDQLSEEYLARARQLCESREQEARLELEHEQSVDFEVIQHAVAHCDRLRAEEARRANVAQQHSEVRATYRHQRDLERAEATGRQAVVMDERAGWLGVERRLQREAVAEGRRVVADVTRQVTHQRKLDDRNNRMGLARAHFLERQVLLATAARTTPIEQEIFPAFTPRPPEMILVHQQLQRLTLATQPAKKRRSTADETLAKELGTPESRMSTRLNVAVRSLTAQLQAARVVIERDERMERYAIVSEAHTPTHARDRVALAHSRRVADQLAREQQVVERIERDDQRSQQVQRRRKEEQKSAKALEAAVHCEGTARVAIKTREDDWWRKFEGYVDAVAGKRILGAFDTVVAAEHAGRAEIVAAEVRFRDTLRVSAAHHKPQSRVVHVEPLPPPKSKFDIPGSSPRAHQHTKPAKASSQSNTKRSSRQSSTSAAPTGSRHAVAQESSTSDSNKTKQPSPPAKKDSAGENRHAVSRKQSAESGEVAKTIDGQPLTNSQSHPATVERSQVDGNPPSASHGVDTTASASYRDGDEDGGYGSGDFED
jgi:hypothetical protein